MLVSGNHPKLRGPAGRARPGVGHAERDQTDVGGAVGPHVRAACPAAGRARPSAGSTAQCRKVEVGPALVEHHRARQRCRRPGEGRAAPSDPPAAGREGAWIADVIRVPRPSSLRPTVARLRRRTPDLSDEARVRLHGCNGRRVHLFADDGGYAQLDRADGALELVTDRRRHVRANWCGRQRLCAAATCWCGPTTRTDAVARAVAALGARRSASCGGCAGPTCPSPPRVPCRTGCALRAFRAGTRRTRLAHGQRRGLRVTTPSRVG